jgi:hypothetical protein
MAPRTELQTLLEGVLGSGNVYFQPPASLQMAYPCIVYARDGARSSFADNLKYRNYKRYQVTVIDRNPDSLVPDRVAELPLSSFDRFYVSSGLNHDVFTLYH